MSKQNSNKHNIEGNILKNEERELKLIKEAQEEAKSIKDEAIQKLQIKFSGSSKGHSFKDMIQSGEMDIKTYVELHCEIYEYQNQVNVDNQSYWVDQGEVGFIYKKEIESGIKIGTDNIQQCVAVIVNGVDKEDEPLTALAHFDKYNTPTSLENVLDKFQNKNLNITIYGGRDQDNQENVSNDNIKVVEEVLEKKYNFQQEEKNKDKNESLIYESKIENITIKEKVRSKNFSSEIIFNPNNNEITEGIYSLKGTEIAYLRKIDRKFNVTEKGHNFSINKVATERNSNLRIINLKNCDNPEEFSKEYLDETKAKRILTLYCTNYDKEIQKIDSESKDFPEYYNNEFKPFIEGAFYAQEKLGLSIEKEDLYNGKAITNGQLDNFIEKEKNTIGTNNLNIDNTKNDIEQKKSELTEQQLNKLLDNYSSVIQEKKEDIINNDKNGDNIIEQKEIEKNIDINTHFTQQQLKAVSQYNTLFKDEDELSKLNNNINKNNNDDNLNVSEINFPEIENDDILENNGAINSFVSNTEKEQVKEKGEINPKLKQLAVQIGQQISDQIIKQNNNTNPVSSVTPTNTPNNVENNQSSMNKN